jgi:hypothetical protein
MRQVNLAVAEKAMEVYNRRIGNFGRKVDI